MSDFNASQPIRTEANGDVVAKIADGTTPSQLLSIDSNGKITAKMDDAAGNGITSQVNGTQRALDVGINVAGVQVDPRDVRALTSADIVSAAQSGTWNITNISGTVSLPTGAATETTLAAINSKLVSGTDIGDVTVNNAAGAAAVNIQDGGNSITVDATNLDIRDLTATDVVTANQGAANTIANAWAVHPTDGTNSQAYLSTGEAKVSVTQALPAGTNNIGIVSANTRDGSGTAVTSTSGGAKVGLDVALINATGAISSSNPLPVIMSNVIPGTDVLDYQTSSSVAAGASVNHDYTVTTGKTLSLQQVSASASGKIKVEIKIAAATKVVKFNSTSSPNIDHSFNRPQEIVAATVIRVTITNLDKAAMDVYSTREGFEY